MLLRAVIYPRTAQVFHLYLGWEGYLVFGVFWVLFFFFLYFKSLCKDLLESCKETQVRLFQASNFFPSSLFLGRILVREAWYCSANAVLTLQYDT